MLFRNPSPAEEKEKLKVCELLESDRLRLLMEQPFVGAILIRQNLIPVVDSRCPTACTDGQNIFVAPEFYLALPPAGRRFLLAHEVWHTVYLHFLRRNGRDVEYFNIATDMEINRMLVGERFKAPEGALLPPQEWRNLNAEEIYERLPKDQIPYRNFDTHLEKGNDDVSSGNVSEDNGAKPNGGGGQNDASIDDVPGSKDEISVIDPDYQVDFGNNPEESVREKVVEAATQYEKQRGKLPGNIAQIVEDFRAGKLHWKELLAQFVTSCFCGSRRWLPPNRRYISSGLYLQSRRDIKLRTVLAIDTSGSTSKALPQFASELVNLLNSFGQYELKVICCDYDIQSIETYSTDNPFKGETIKFKGGGGTSFKPVFKYLKDNPSEAQILIYFTDGYGDKPEKPPFPVMWVITPDGKNSIQWGYEIKLEK